MRGMNSDSVDLIYLDPPFNSKANYAAPIGSEAAGAEFKDTWTLQDVDVAWLDLIEQKHPRLNRVIHAAMTPGDKSYLIYMAIRLLEMHRLLKPTGSIYLHCDPTMSHYLKLVMDAIWGRKNFVNEIVWHYDGPQRPSRRRFGTKHDIIFRYGQTSKYFSDPEGISPFQPVAPESLGKNYKKLPDGRYYYTTPRGDYTDASVERLDGEERIEYTVSGKVRVRHFLSVGPNKQIGRHKQLPDVWNDITSLGHAGGHERVGYPTQKPIALVGRLVKAASSNGDMILDPFCGCATACIAAQASGREWVGIDVSPKAADLVKHRMRNELGLFFGGAHRTDMPRRTDIGTIPRYNSTINLRSLYGLQAGDCAGCGEHFEMRNLEVDHIIARSKGGTDHIDNLQLLCGHCNRVKGSRGMEYLIAKLAA